MPPTDAAPLIVCFGDSLTAGYQSPTRAYPQPQETPYGVFLQQRLGPQAWVAVSGVCGERAGEMGLRFHRDVLRHQPDWVVILGGTNDLGRHTQPDEILPHLVRLYDRALAQHIRPVAVTVPSIRPTDAEMVQATASAERGAGLAAEGWRWLQGHLDRRRTLNDLIAGYCAKHTLACVDLFTATAEPDTGWLAARYSNDGLHLTSEGYERLAALLYERVFAGAFGRQAPISQGQAGA